MVPQIPESESSLMAFSLSNYLDTVSFLPVTTVEVENSTPESNSPAGSTSIMRQTEPTLGPISWELVRVVSRPNAANAAAVHCQKIVRLHFQWFQGNVPTQTQSGEWKQWFFHFQDHLVTQVVTMWLIWICLGIITHGQPPKAHSNSAPKRGKWHCLFEPQRTMQVSRRSLKFVKAGAYTLHWSNSNIADLIMLADHIWL